MKKGIKKDPGMRTRVLAYRLEKRLSRNMGQEDLVAAANAREQIYANVIQSPAFIV